MEFSGQQRLVAQTADGELVARLLAEPGVDVNARVTISEPDGNVVCPEPYSCT